MKFYLPPSIASKNSALSKVIEDVNKFYFDNRVINEGVLPEILDVRLFNYNFVTGAQASDSQTDRKFSAKIITLPRAHIVSYIVQVLWGDLWQGEGAGKGGGGYGAKR